VSIRWHQTFTTPTAEAQNWNPAATIVIHL